jgi:hypothetical protein
MHVPLPPHGASTTVIASTVPAYIVSALPVNSHFWPVAAPQLQLH